MKYLRRKPVRVTIIVAIPTRDGGVVIASDSQTTCGTAKRTDTNKMDVARFVGGKSAVIAQSGEYSFGARVVETFQKLASKSSLSDYRKPADLLDESIRLTRQQLVHNNNWENNRDLEQAYLLENPASFIVAYRFENQPYIYVADVVPGFSRREQSYACVGCGSTVAEFILSRMELSKLDYEQTLAVAIYTIEEVKKVDAACGGPTKIASVDSEECTVFNDEAGIKVAAAYARIIAKNDESLRREWRAAMKGFIIEAASEFQADPPTIKKAD